MATNEINQEAPESGKPNLVGADGTEMKINEKDPESLNYIPHPNNIFAVKAEETKTKGGVWLPEGYDKDSNPTPIGKILAIGENVSKQFENTEFSLNKGDFVYIDAQFMRFGKIDGVSGIILMADGILGKVGKAKDNG